ncbi:hypothetical protein [Streptomyces sp. NPDC090022]|uniref:hypothetical protein n=1 Tax=Streptomyces sp. NPDC090022 TaxID=3365920 RepID=UPI0037FA5DC3
MPSPCDPEFAPAGDVGAALMLIDSRLKAVHDDSGEAAPENRLLADRFTASLGPEEAKEVLDGVCTIMYMMVRWLRLAHEQHGKDVIEYVVPNLVASLRMMPRSVGPEVVPTMAGMVIAAGTGLSPNLWRGQYGQWTEAEMRPLEATAFLLAEHINRITDDPDFVTRMIAEALSGADHD